MTKLFKNSKSVLSIALAFAVLAVSLFTGVVINTEAACASSNGVIEVLAYNYDEPETGNRYYDSVLADTAAETGDSWESAIIIDSGLELSYLARYAGNETKGKYYKVADGIKGFDMSGGKINLDGTLDDNFDAIQTSGKRHDLPGNNYFQGHFDGNGATVYGLLCTGTPDAAGLFALAMGNVTIKNVNVSLSYLKAKQNAGGIVGIYLLDPNLANPNTDNALNIENCSVTDCHIETTQGGYFGNSAAGYIMAGTGAIYGGARGYQGGVADAAPIVVNNCFIKLDEDHFVSPAETQAIENCLHGGIGGVAVSNEAKFYNCVVIGITPYSSYNSGVTASNATAHQHTRLAARFTNIYTDAVAGSALSMGGGMATNLQNYDGRITQLTPDQMQGAAAVENMDLDWSVWLANPNGYPEFRSAHKGATLTDNGNGTHSIACACGVYGPAADHVFVGGVCECGVEFNCAAKKTIYWNGTTDSKLDDNGESGADANNAIIIDSAEELAYLVKDASIRDYSTGVEGGVATVADKYYKIADGIGAIVLQPKAYAEEIMALDSAAEVKDYFSDTSKTFLEWAGCEGWEQGSFAGTFDGNGVTIYGLYGDPNSANGNKGLFSTVDAGATFRNFTIKNAYLHTTKANFNVGAIACVSSSGQYDKGFGLIWVDRCAVVNSYIRNDCESWQRSGIMLGTLFESEAAYFDNCFVYGNDAAYGSNDTPMAILGSAKNSISPENATNIPEGLETVLASDNLYRSMVRNSIVIGATPYISAADSYRVNDKDSFVNVYTDAEVENAAANVTYEENQIKKLSAIDGATIAAEAENLDWNNVWLAAGVPAFRDAHDDVLSAAPYSEDNYAGHTETCSCGLGGLIVKHDYDENYHCAACGFTCDHEGGEAYVTFTPVGGDCLTATSMYGECDCGFTATVPTGSAPGHTFTYNEEDPSTCQTQGTAAYNYCSVCEKKYAADADKMAAFETALSDEDLKLPLADHVHAVDGNNVPVYSVTDAGHQKVCGVCSEAYGDVEPHIGAPVDNGDGTHSITCTVEGCGYAEESAPHVFGDDNACDICSYTCTAHDYIDGETIELTFEQRYGEDSESYKDICYYVEQICSICGTKGENKVIEHTTGEWERPMMDGNFVAACTGEGQHTELLICTVCFFEVDSKIVTDAKTGHSFDDVDAVEATCASTGTIAHKYCNACGNTFATDAADDEAFENALNPYDGSMDTPINPENHQWVEFGSEADCENDGVVAHKYCKECDELVIGEETVELEVDWDEYYKYDDEGNPVGPGAVVGSSYNRYENAAIADFIAENYADSGIEVPAYPEDDTDWEAMAAYYEVYDPIFYELYQLDENFYEAWGEYWLEYWATVQFNTRYEYVTAAAEEAGVDFVIPATGHDLKEVKEVAATYDKEGTKAHYACECGKLYSDAEGKNEVTAESLVIAKLVKEEENKPSTDDKTDNKAEGDKSDKSPVTGESVASVAAVAALMGAAFVLVRKARKA